MKSARFLQAAQDFQHGVAIFTAGQANHNPVAVFDHVEIGNGFADVTAQALLQFIEVVLFFFANFLILQHLIIAQFMVWHTHSAHGTAGGRN